MFYFNQLKFSLGIFSVVILIAPIFSKKHDSNICNLTSCQGLMSNDSHVMTFCEKHDLSVTERCCTNSTGGNVSIVGLDLEDCQLVNISGLLTNFSSLQVLILFNNPLTALKDEDFTGLVHLDYLSLPEDKLCPGGTDAWMFIGHDGPSNSTVCKEEVQMCDFYNMTCPNGNSFCTNVGPGMTECLCLPDYYGYKCLNKGTFPTLPFAIGLCISTVLVSGLMWMTQRRKVIKTQ